MVFGGIGRGQEEHESPIKFQIPRNEEKVKFPAKKNSFFSFLKVFISITSMSSVEVFLQKTVSET